MDGNLQTEDFNLMCIWINNMQSRIESNKLNQIIKAYKELNGIFFKNNFFMVVSETAFKSRRSTMNVRFARFQLVQLHSLSFAFASSFENFLFFSKFNFFKTKILWFEFFFCVWNLCKKIMKLTKKVWWKVLCFSVKQRCFLWVNTSAFWVTSSTWHTKK